MTINFPTGAVRGSAPPGLHRIPKAALDAWAAAFEEGSKTYGEHNWLKGLPISNLMAHALEHIYSFLQGDNSEDHLGHALWNVGAAIHYMKYNPSLDDRAPYAKHAEISAMGPTDHEGYLHMSYNGRLWFSVDTPDDVVASVAEAGDSVPAAVAAESPGEQLGCAAKSLECTDCCGIGEIGAGCRLCGKVSRL